MGGSGVVTANLGWVWVWVEVVVVVMVAVWGDGVLG